MEILIIGGIVVLIMVFISTQIKKSAALAFEREVIETDEFSIVKPTGLMNPIRDNSEYAFEAYSKDFGEKRERNTWQAQIYLTVSDGLNFAQVCKNIKSKADKILSENFEAETSEDQKIRILETEKTEDDISFHIFHKIVESKHKKKIYDLQIKVLKAFRSDYAERVEETMESFRLK